MKKRILLLLLAAILLYLPAFEEGSGQPIAVIYETGIPDTGGNGEIFSDNMMSNIVEDEDSTKIMQITQQSERTLQIQFPAEVPETASSPVADEPTSKEPENLNDKALDNPIPLAVDYVNPGKDSEKIAYFTIDDCTKKDNLIYALDVLKEYRVKATFFVLPMKGLIKVYQRMLEEGHVIGTRCYVFDEV